MQAGYFQPWVPPRTAFSLSDSLQLYKGGLIDTKTLGYQAQVLGDKGVLSALSDDKTVGLLLDAVAVVPGAAIVVLAVKGAFFLWDVIKEYVPALAECINGLVDFLVDAAEWVWENIRLTIEGFILTVSDWIDGWFDKATETVEQARAQAEAALDEAEQGIGGYGNIVGASGWWGQDEYDAAQQEQQERQEAEGDAWAQSQIAQDNAEAAAEDEWGDPVEEGEDPFYDPEMDPYDQDALLDMTDADWADVDEELADEGYWIPDDYMDPGEDLAADLGW